MKYVCQSLSAHMMLGPRGSIIQVINFARSSPNTFALTVPRRLRLACIKQGVSGLVSTSITSSVKYYCSSTATEDIASALSVFGFYCSAARKEVVVTVAESSKCLTLYFSF
jgi:hypothetical protein